jgi:hypothetical protein
MSLGSTACEQKDGYLGRWLTEEERRAFEAHLAVCAACRQFVQEQRRFDDLVARAHATLVSVPAGLADQIEARLQSSRRRRAVAWASGLAAAGVMICLLAGWLLAHKAEPVPSAVVTTPFPQTEPTPDPRSLVKVKFPPSADVIAVPQRTENPSLTIIWVYPTIKMVQDPMPAPHNSFEPPERNGI